MKGEKLCYSKDTVDEIWRIFEQLGCAKDRFFVLEKRKFPLLLTGLACGE